MSIVGPHCICEGPLALPDRPCPIHGSKVNKMESDALREGGRRLKAENDRLRDHVTDGVALVQALREACWATGSPTVPTPVAEAIGALRSWQERLTTATPRDTAG